MIRLARAAAASPIPTTPCRRARRFGAVSALRAAVACACALGLAACGGGGNVGIGGSVGVGSGGIGVGGGGVGVGVGLGTGFGLGGGFGSAVTSFTLNTRPTGPDTASLVWSGRPDAREFVIVRNGAELTRVGGQTTALDDRALAPGGNYCYQVFAFLNGGGGAYSNEACARTWTGPTPPSELSSPVPTQRGVSPPAVPDASRATGATDAAASPDAASSVAQASPESPPWRTVGEVGGSAIDEALASPPGGGGVQRLRRAADGGLLRDWLGPAGSGSEPIAPAVGLAAGGWAAASLAACATATPCVVYGSGTIERPEVARFAWRRADGTWLDEPLAAGMAVAPDALSVGTDGVPIATLSAPDGSRIAYARTAAGWSATERR
jgi:hypothetical protein